MKVARSMNLSQRTHVGSADLLDLGSSHFPQQSNHFPFFIQNIENEWPLIFSQLKA